MKEEPMMGLYQNAQKYNEDRRNYNDEVKQKNRKIMARNRKLREKNNGMKSKKEKKLISTKPYFYGFKFLRLREDPLWELIKLEGPFAPELKISPIFD